MESSIHDIHGLLDLVRSGKIEPITMWRYYVSQWDEEEQRIFLLKLIAISKNEKEEGRQGSDVDKWASYHASYLSRKINEVRQLKQESDKKEISERTKFNKSHRQKEKRELSPIESKYFAKAIEASLMKQTENGYKWLHNQGLKASLGYFLNRVFNPKGTAQIPYQYIESLFNMSRLDTAIDQALTL